MPICAVAAPLNLVTDGEANCIIVHAGDASEAAAELLEHLNLISGAQPEVRELKSDEAIPGGTAILLGELARIDGLPESRSREGYRILRDGARLLIAGQTPEATYFATCHFLETLGVRWFFDNELGTVIPKMKTIAVDELDIAEAPDFIHRQVSGANWHKKTWKRRNRLGGIPMATSHGWGQVSAKEHFDNHPEYFALRGGERKKGGWLCTSNPEMRKLFATTLGDQVRGAGPTSVSLSPPDGTGFCECEACTAQDVPDGCDRRWM